MIGKLFDMNVINPSKDFTIRPFEFADQEAAKTLVLSGLAVRFYERYGFHILGTYVDDTGFQGVRFSKDLL
jgi:hypothetical protein